MTSNNPPTSALIPLPLVLVLTRLIDAPRDLVFAAWTDPAHFGQWWGPRNHTNPVCEFDLRVGGSLLVNTLAPDGSVQPMKGQFLEIVEPERLIFCATGLEDEQGIPGLESIVTVTFEELGGKTRMTVSDQVTYVSAAAAFAIDGMESYWNETLDKLAESVPAGRTT